jgi:hypothetical protein
LYSSLFSDEERQQLESQEDKSFGGIKFHLLAHLPAFIAEYGSPSGWDAETWEAAHKVFVKELFRMVAPSTYGKEPSCVHLALLRLALNKQVMRVAMQHVQMAEENEKREWAGMGSDITRSSKAYVSYREGGLEVAGMGGRKRLFYSVEEESETPRWVAEGDADIERAGQGLWQEEAYPGFSLDIMMDKLESANTPNLEGGEEVGSQAQDLHAFVARVRDGRGQLYSRDGLSLRRRGGVGHLILYGNSERKTHAWVSREMAFGGEAGTFGSLVEVLGCLEFCEGGLTMHFLAVRVTLPDLLEETGEDGGLNRECPFVVAKCAQEPGVGDQPFEEDPYAYRLIPIYSVLGGAFCFESTNSPEAGVDFEGGRQTYKPRCLWVIPRGFCDSLKQGPMDGIYRDGGEPLNEEGEPQLVGAVARSLANLLRGGATSALSR